MPEQNCKKNDRLSLVIEDINNLGCGVSHLSDGRVVFVRDAVPGDIIDAKLIKVNKSYAVARVEGVITPSPDRIENTCPAAGCGGCVYRTLSYEKELLIKHDYVKTAFRKAGLFHVAEAVEPVRTTGITEGYRNKGQYPVQNGKGGVEAGFYAVASHRLVPADCCALQPPIFAELVAFICDFCNKNNIRAYDEVQGGGLLRHIYLRRGQQSGELMVCLVINGKTLPKKREFAEKITKAFPKVASVMLNFNEKNTNVVLGDRFECIGGKPYITDTLCGVTLRISPDAFYQVNHDACELLYSLAAERAELKGMETVLDLYCGIGSIGLSMADRARQIIGIEIVDAAVACARENAALNGIENAYFYCGDSSDAEKLLTAAEAAHGSLDPKSTTVILDPPRKGSTPELISCLSSRGFDRVVYISCNPDTLARDCKLFQELGYQIGTVTPVDLFPRTGHCEAVCLIYR